jgi:hypothetical protein
MSSIPPLKTDHKADVASQQIQDKLREYTGNLSAPLLRGALLELEFDASATNPILPLIQRINHKLARIPQGWILVTVQPKNGTADIYEWSGTDDKRLNLLATDDCWATVWVF